MRSAVVCTGLLLHSFIVTPSQLSEQSDVTTYVAEGRALAERHAWWQYRFGGGKIPPISPNQLGQEYIRYNNTPIRHDDYDRLFVPVVAVTSRTRTPIFIIRGPEINDAGTWTYAPTPQPALPHPQGSRQNPIDLT